MVSIFGTHHDVWSGCRDGDDDGYGDDDYDYDGGGYGDDDYDYDDGGCGYGDYDYDGGGCGYGDDSLMAAYVMGPKMTKCLS